MFDQFGPFDAYRSGYCPNCHAAMTFGIVHRRHEERRCDACRLTWTHNMQANLLTVWADKHHATHMTIELLQCARLPGLVIEEAVRNVRKARMRSLMIKG